MSKELDALERLYKCNDDDYTMGYQHHDYKLLQEALQRLEAIDNANPNEALKCVDVLKEDGCITTLYQGKALETIRQSLLKEQEQEKENAELKRLLSVIKEKSDLSALEMANDVNEFNEMTFHKKPYTQEEFELLKRYFK